MPLDVEAMAAEVVLLVKTAIAPVLERLAAAEARLAVLGDVRDRVVTMETKAATPVSLDAGFDDLRDRLVTLETRAAGPSLTDMAVVDLRERVAALDLGGLRERVAVLETKAPVAGPQGHDGKDGTDGLGFDDLTVEFDGDRTMALKFVRGDVTKTFPITLPFLKYQGVYQHGKSYDVGDTVTWAGHLWYCRETTITPPGDGSKLWQLCVRKGDQGKAGVNGSDLRPAPVVSVGRPTLT